MTREPLVTATVHVNWSDRSHWANEALPCRLGDGPTKGRDESGQPCHQSCAEQELAAEIAKTPDGRVPDERYRPTGTENGSSQ